MLGIDFASRSVSGGLNARTCNLRFGRGELCPEPSVGDPAHSVKSLGPTAAQPNLERILDRPGHESGSKRS